MSALHACRVVGPALLWNRADTTHRRNERFPLGASEPSAPAIRGLLGASIPRTISSQPRLPEPNSSRSLVLCSVCERWPGSLSYPIIGFLVDMRLSQVDLSNFQSSCCFLILPLFVLPPHFPDLWRPQVVYSNFFDLSNCRFHELFCGFLALLCRLAAVASRFFKFLWVFKLWFPCSLCSSWSLRFFRLAWLEFLVLSVVKKVSSA